MKALKALKNALTVAPKGYTPSTKPGKPLAGKPLANKPLGPRTVSAAKKTYTKDQVDAAMKKTLTEIEAARKAGKLKHPAPKNTGLGTLTKQAGRPFKDALDVMKGKPQGPLIAQKPTPVRPGFKPPKAVAPTPDVMPPKGGPKRVQPGFKPPVGAAGFAGLGAALSKLKGLTPSTVSELRKPSPVKKMAKGGGVERKGKTKGKFI